MSRYSLLFTVAIDHQFFSRGAGPALEFMGCSDTDRWIRRMNLLIRSDGKSFSIFYDEDRSEAIGLETRESGLIPLMFKVFTMDQGFKNYTEPAIQNENAILFFEVRDHPDIPADGDLLLHDGEFVTEKDFRELEELARIPGLLSSRDLVMRPDFIVRLEVRNEDIAVSADGSRRLAKSYRVRFEARQTIWKYYVLGHTKKGVPGITDVDKQTEFEFTGKTSLPGERAALTYRSKTPIPLREKYDCRFQLRDKSVAGGKVLIRRLPVASASQFGKDMIDGREMIVSEIYINC